MYDLGYVGGVVANALDGTVSVLAGSALGLAGAVMQGITRNPLADPGILGVNAGAALAVVVGMDALAVHRRQARQRDVRQESTCRTLVTQLGLFRTI